MLNMPMDDALWARIETALGVGRNVIAGGRRPLDNRSVLSGILLVLATGIPWERLPIGLGFGSGMTCLRRLRRWQREGKWEALRDLLLVHLPNADRIAWWRAEAGGTAVRAVMLRQARTREPQRAAHLRLVSDYR
jgi:transposase